MAGKIIADIIEAPYNRITLNVGNTVVATMNASGLYTSTGNLLITQANSIGTAAIENGAITRAKMGYPGAVLQVVSNTNFELVSATTTTRQSGLTLAITPTSATSKILVYWVALCRLNTANYSAFFGIAKTTATGSLLTLTNLNAPSTAFSTPVFCSAYDSPNTTSEVVYVATVSSEAGGTARFNDRNSSSYPSLMVAMEIAA